MKKPSTKFEYYINLAGMWRWHLLLNGMIVATSEGEYKSKQECLQTIKDINLACFSYNMDSTNEINVFDMLNRPRISAWV